MFRRSIVALAVILFFAAAAHAQIKSSGTVQCDKPDPQHMLPITDTPDHSFAISQAKCTWTKPLEIDGVQSKEGTSWDSSEIRAGTTRVHGYFEDTMANGDKILYRYDGKAAKDGTAEDKWSVVRGTGKFKGLKGSGTCEGKVSPDGSATWECEGEYQLPAAKPKAGGEAPAKKGKP